MNKTLNTKTSFATFIRAREAAGKMAVARKSVTLTKEEIDALFEVFVDLKELAQNALV